MTALYDLPLSDRGILSLWIINQEAGASVEAGVGAEAWAKMPRNTKSATIRDHIVDRKVGPGLAQIRCRIITNQRVQVTGPLDHQARPLDNNVTTPVLTQQDLYRQHYHRNLQVEMGSCPYTILLRRLFPTFIQFHILLGMVRSQFLSPLRLIIRDRGNHIHQWAVHHLRTFTPGLHRLHSSLVAGHLRLRPNSFPLAKGSQVAFIVCWDGEVAMEEVMGDGSEGMILY